MRKKVLVDNEIEISLLFLKKDREQIFYNIIKEIKDYYPDLHHEWEFLLNPQELINLQFNDVNHLDIEHFKKIFIESLGALVKNEITSITLNLLHDKSPSWESASEIEMQHIFQKPSDAIEYLLIHGIILTDYNAAGNRIFNPPRRYNLWNHIQNIQLETDPKALALIKELILMLPQSREFWLDEMDLKILMDYFGLKNHAQVPLNLIRDRLQEYEKTPVYYFNRESLIHSSKHYSVVTLGTNYAANRLIPKLSQYKEDWEEFLIRQGHGALSILNGLLLLPNALNALIAEYIIDSTYPASLAKSLIAQLRDFWGKRYLPKIRDLNSKPSHVFQILYDALKAVSKNKSVRYDWYVLNPPLAPQLEYYELVATKVLEKLIRGEMKVQAEPEPQSFDLLECLKNLPGYGPANPAIDQFILGLLELALNTHKPLKINKAFLQSKSRFFSRLTFKSPLRKRMWFEEKLNELLTNSGAEKSAVNFITVDDKNQVTLYVRTEARRALRELTQNPSISLHISSLFMQRVMQQFMNFVMSQIDQDLLPGNDEQKRRKVVGDLMSKISQTETHSLNKFSSFQHHVYDCQLELPPASYEKMITGLFSQKPCEKLFDPSELNIIKAILPLQKALDLYKGSDVRAQFLNKFVEEFKSQYEAVKGINNYERVIGKCLEFLNVYEQKLASLHQSISTPTLPIELGEAILDTYQSISIRVSSLRSVLRKSPKGDFAISFYDIQPSAFLMKALTVR